MSAPETSGKGEKEAGERKPSIEDRLRRHEHKLRLFGVLAGLLVGAGGLWWAVRTAGRNWAEAEKTRLTAASNEEKAQRDQRDAQEKAQGEQRNREYQFRIYETCRDIARLGVRLAASKTRDDRDLWDMEALLWSGNMMTEKRLKTTFENFKTRLTNVRRTSMRGGGGNAEDWKAIKNCAIDISVLCEVKLCAKMKLSPCPDGSNLRCAQDVVSAR